MRKKVIMFIIFAVIFLFIGKLILFPKDINNSVDKILQKKAEQFYENQESFEKIVAYVNNFDFRSITENNEMWTEIKVDGITFRLKEWEKEDNYRLSLYPAKTLLLQLMESDENQSVDNAIGESSSMSICYDKKSYSNVIVTFSIEDARLESIMANLVWHNSQSDYETLTSRIYPLDANWQIECMGVGH